MSVALAEFQIMNMFVYILLFIDSDEEMGSLFL